VNFASDFQLYDVAGRRKYLTEAERIRFLVEADHGSRAEQALLYVLTFTGCRVSEALALTTHHLDTERDTLTFRTLKRRKLRFRTIHIPPEVTEMLVRLRTSAGERFWALHRASAWRLVTRTMTAAEITGPMANCRGLRHGFGIRAAERNVPPPLIQRWMGHASPDTTAIYLDAVGAEERAFAVRTW
jgi:integrase